MILRPATTHDSDFLLYLKNDPIMRIFSVVTHDEIKKEDHEKWLESHLQEISIIEDLMVANTKGDVVETRIGMLKITDDKEVTINLHPLFRGNGYGGKILALYCPQGVWAKIVNGNVPSMRIFLANGFKITGYENNYYVLKN